MRSLLRLKSLKFVAFVLAVTVVVWIRVHIMRNEQSNQTSPVDASLREERSMKATHLTMTRNSLATLKIFRQEVGDYVTKVPNHYGNTSPKDLYENHRTTTKIKDKIEGSYRKTTTNKVVTSYTKRHDVSKDESVQLPEQSSFFNIPYLTLHHVNESTTVVHTTSPADKVKMRFEQRNNEIRETCKNETYGDIIQIIRGKGRTISLASNRLSVCLVPKVGTTYLTYKLKSKLRFNKEKPTIRQILDPADKKSFFLVREPYGRLVSAYFSKVVSHPYWWVSLGRFIVSKFRRHPTNKSLTCGHDVTFPEFIKYFLHAQKYQKYKNNHFIPIHELCNPCQPHKHFDYIGHLETMKEDMTYILDSVNVTTHDDFRFDPVKTIVSNFMLKRDARHQICGRPWCPTFQRLWWALQSNGHIASSIPMSLRDQECDHITADQMMNIALKAAEESRGIVDKASQKAEAVAKLYAQVSLADRLRVRDALMMDFKLFGYDAEPHFVFPPNEQ